MNILLINPPDKNVLIGNNPEILEQERGYNPPLGLLYLASYIKNNSSHKINIIDCQVDNIDYKELDTKISEFDPDIIGMTTMSFTILDVIKTIKIVKNRFPKCCIIVGGPHAHLYPIETMKLENIDFVIMGEGEKPFLKFIDIYNKKEFERFTEVEGLVWRNKENKIILNPVAALITELDEIPIPDRTMTTYKKYSSVIAKRTPITTMITSRGCPYRCSFCDRPHLGKIFRAHSAQYVVNELKQCVKLGIHEIIIYDDTFTIDRKRVMKICKMLIKEDLDLEFDIRARVNTVDMKMLKALKKAGCARIHFGVEAGTPEMLKVLRKDITLEQALKAFKMAKKAKINTLAYFMIGNPGETIEQINETLKFMIKLDPDFVHITILTPFPGTEIYFNALNKGIIKKDIWKEFANNPNPDFKPQYWEENVTTKQLQGFIKKAYKNFYTRPTYIIKKLSKIRSIGELKRKLKAGIKVILMK